MNSSTPFDDLLPTFPEEVALAAKECWKVCKGSKFGDWMSHIHHGEWLECLDEPVENRIRYILLHKDPAERVERLRRLRPFDESKATPEWRKALVALNKANAAYYTARSDYGKIWLTFQKSWNALCKASLSPEMLAMHAQVCGCPWNEITDIFGIKR